MFRFEKIDNAIQIVKGHPLCPHCAGDVSLSGVALKDEIAIPAFSCHDCKEVSGLLFENDDSGNAAVTWIVIPIEGQRALVAAEAVSLDRVRATNSKNKMD